MSYQPPLERKLRQQVQERYYTCKNCDATDTELEGHHIIPDQPIAEGGKNVLENLVSTCIACHRILEATTRPTRTTAAYNENMDMSNINRRNANSDRDYWNGIDLLLCCDRLL